MKLNFHLNPVSMLRTTGFNLQYILYVKLWHLILATNVLVAKSVKYEQKQVKIKAVY